ncbi:MAG TPA: aldose 1-epimerase family protein [Armatimonadota bacterium]|nr:aldose 1-epimerase family protein [Armatimonadota bacterium]HOS43216.1 aldose 1-epimerase family protein [Armatimonadota bacterium]
MVRLFGRDFTRRELLSYTSNLAQLGGIRPIELAAGRERGVRAFDVATGSGFEFTVLADRALDITRMAMRGVPMAHLTPSGQAHPAYYEAAGAGWLRTFPGGAVTTCGLAAAGAPCVDEGQALPLHGRVSALPVEELGYWGAWQGDDYGMHITGTLTEGVLFGTPLRLTRTLSATLGGTSVRIRDTVENIGGEPAPHMMLYHCNFGWPLLGPDSALVTNSRQVTPRDAAAAEGLLGWSTFQEPTPGYAEQCFYHDIPADNAGDVRVALLNPALGLGVGLRYHQKTLPRFIQWKQMGFGHYVLGLEPANCLVEGRDTERARGTLVVLQPGESRDYTLELTALDGAEAMEAFAAAIMMGG